MRVNLDLPTANLVMCHEKMQRKLTFELPRLTYRLTLTQTQKNWP